MRQGYAGLAAAAHMYPHNAGVDHSLGGSEGGKHMCATQLRAGVRANGSCVEHVQMKRCAVIPGTSPINTSLFNASQLNSTQLPPASPIILALSYAPCMPIMPPGCHLNFDPAASRAVSGILGDGERFAVGGSVSRIERCDVDSVVETAMSRTNGSASPISLGASPRSVASPSPSSA